MAFELVSSKSLICFSINLKNNVLLSLPKNFYHDRNQWGRRAGGGVAPPGHHPSKNLTLVSDFCD